VMFTAEYQDAFYHAIRDALHAEVDSWRTPDASNQVERLWHRVSELEPQSRNASPTRFRIEGVEASTVEHSQLIPLCQISGATREA
jgi:anaerobic magnesium-protoporphyrin IX monomethyl ester cyclase